MKKQQLKLKKISNYLFLAALLLNTPTNVFATNTNFVTIEQNSTDLPKPVYQNAMGSFFVMFNNLNISNTDFYSGINAYFNLDTQHTFEIVNKKFDTETGYTHYSYQHFYNNVKVHGDMVFVHEKNAKITHINGQIVTNFNGFKIENQLSNDKIIAIAQANFGATENVIQSEIQNYIYKQQINESVALKNVAKVNLSTLKPLKSIDFLIDVQTGEIINQISKLHHADTPSSSNTFFRGTKSITVDSYNGSYRLKDNFRNIRTLNGSQLNGSLNNDGSFSGYTEYTNSTPNFAMNSLKPAVEVHWAIKETYDYYKNIHNRLSFDGNNHIIHNYYDAGNLLGTDENAAAFDEVSGGTVYNGMFYGKGGSLMYPVVGLDVVGHEFSHMVVSRNGNGGLDYENESGAMNESFADIFGTSIEFFVNDNPNWTIGEGLFKNNTTPNYFRSMSNPNSAPSQIGLPNQPDTYKGTFWQKTTNNPNGSNDYGGVHINSGVGNHWFYLLSMGGQGTNDIGNVYYVNPITIKKAEKIAYTALTTGLSPSATYLDFYNASQAAAVALYGSNSNEWEQVVNAWYAVGIGAKAASTPAFEMQTKLKVYPNPVENDLLTIESEIEGNVTVEVFDLTGKSILKPITLQNKTVINTASLKAGMYMLKFNSNLGSYTQKLIIK